MILQCALVLQCAQCLLDMRWQQGWALGRSAHTPSAAIAACSYSSTTHRLSAPFGTPNSDTAHHAYTFCMPPSSMEASVLKETWTRIARALLCIPSLVSMHRTVRRKGKLNAVEITLMRSRSQLHGPLCRLDLIPAHGTVSESVHLLLGHIVQWKTTSRAVSRITGQHDEYRSALFSCTHWLGVGPHQIAPHPWDS